MEGGRLIEVGVPFIFFHYRVINFLVNMESIQDNHYRRHPRRSRSSYREQEKVKVTGKKGQKKWRESKESLWNGSYHVGPNSSVEAAF